MAVGRKAMLVLSRPLKSFCEYVITILSCGMGCLKLESFLAFPKKTIDQKYDRKPIPYRQSYFVLHMGTNYPK